MAKIALFVALLCASGLSAHYVPQVLPAPHDGPQVNEIIPEIKPLPIPQVEEELIECDDHVVEGEDLEIGNLPSVVEPEVSEIIPETKPLPLPQVEEDIECENEVSILPAPQVPEILPAPPKPEISILPNPVIIF